MRRIRNIDETPRPATRPHPAARRDPPGGVSPTVFVAALALAAALFLPQLAGGQGGGTTAAEVAPALCPTPATPARAL